MNLPIEAAFPLLALGWAAGVGTALACRPARGAAARREMRDAPPGWRSYAPVSRPRHANSDNGATTTPRPPIEPQGQNRVRKIGQTLAQFNDELNNSLAAGYSEERLIWPELLRAPTTARPPIEPQGQAPIRSGYEVCGNLRPWSELKAEFLAHQANVARIEAEQASANAAARRSDIWQPQANKAVQPVQVREPYSPSHVAECGGPCETIGICDCGNPPNLPPGPLHPAPPVNP